MTSIGTENLFFNNIFQIINSITTKFRDFHHFLPRIRFYNKKLDKKMQGVDGLRFWELGQFSRNNSFLLFVFRNRIVFFPMCSCYILMFSKALFICLLFILILLLLLLLLILPLPKCKLSSISRSINFLLFYDVIFVFCCFCSCCCCCCCYYCCYLPYYFTK